MNLKKFFTLLVLLLSCGFIQNAIGQNTSTIQFANPNTTCNGATPTQFCIDVTLQSAGAAYNTEGWATFVNYNTAVLGAPTVTVNSAFSTTDYNTAVNISTPGVINASCEHLTAVFASITSAPVVAYTACFPVVAAGDPGMSFNNSLGFTLIYDQDFAEVPLDPTPGPFNTPVACAVDPCAGVNITVDAGYNCVDGVATLDITNPSFDLTYTIDGIEVVNGDVLQDGETYFVIGTDANGCAGASSAINVDCPPIVDPCLGVGPITATASYSCNGGGLSLNISGGTGAYTTSLAAGATLVNGDYTITVSDNGACNVADATANLTVSCSVDPCAGIAVPISAGYNCIDGVATLIIENPDATLDYTYDGGGVAANGDVLTDGASYIIVVTNADGCTDSDNIGVVDCPAIDPCAGVLVPVSPGYDCTNGVATLVINNPDATLDYTYAGGGAAATGDVLTDGVTYTIVATNADGCSDSDSTGPVDCPPVDPCAGVAVPISAGYNCIDGVATLIIENPDATLDYTYDGGGVAANGDVLTDGASYIIVVTNADGCTDSDNIGVVDCPAIDPCAGVLIPVSPGYDCTDGVATLVINNQDFQFDYTYAGGGAAATGDVLTDGVTYTIVATNADGCSDSDSTGPVDCPGLDPCAGVTITVDASYGCENGVATLILNNQDGVAYTYGDGSTASNGDSVMDGMTYTITGTNANGCTGSIDVTVDCPIIVDPCAGVTINVTASYNCVSGLGVSATGGTAPYTFVINGNVVSNGTILANGTYTITAEDANGCISNQEVTANCSGCTNPPVVALVPPATAVCNSVSEGNTTFNLNTLLGTSTPGGVWSGTGVTGNTFSGAGLATGGYVITYSIAAAGECPAVSGTRTMFVTDCDPAPTAVSDFIAVEPGTTLVTVNVINNDSDNGAIILTGATVNPANGTVAVNGGNVIYTPSAGATGSITITYTIQDNAGQTSTGTLTVLFSGCLANAGSIDLVSNFVGEDDKFVYCDDASIFVLQSSPFNDDNDFTQVYVVTDTLGNIAAIHTGSPIPAPAPGIWQVCAVNYEDGNITGLNVGANTNNLSGCYSINCADKFLILNPIVVTHTIEYDGPDQIVHFQITGGYPTYSGFGGYSVNWPPFNAVYDPELGYATFDLTFPCSAEGPFNFAVYSDGALCDEFITVTLAPNCPVCNPMPGAMTGSQTLCVGQSASVVSNGLEIHTEDGEVATYVLFNPANPNNILQSVNVTSAAQAAVFTFDDANMDYNTTYSVVAYVGPDENGDNLPDLDNAECTAASTPTQLTFLPPLVLASEAICNDIDQTYTVVLTVTGRDADETYEVMGTNTNASFTGPVSIWGPYQGGSTYQFMVTDENGCTSNDVSSDTINCKITPIQLLSFTGEVLSNGNLLKWSTATEYNNDYFTISRSTDGINFTPVATVDGAGNSSNVLNYNLLDKNAPAGLSYYRLVQTDFNGQKSAPVDITLTRGEIKFGITQLMPVPTNANLEVGFASATKNMVTMTIHNVEGKLISTQNVEANTGFNTIRLDVSAYASGVYFITINNGNEVATGRFVKQQ